MQKTSIDYLTHTWNPLAMRCTPVSEGCAHCWHLRMANRLAMNPSVNELKQQSYAGKLDWFTLNEAQLEAPMKRKKPSVIGLQFMGDLFHDQVSFNQIHEIWDIMKACPQHTFLVLTKRPQRMKEALARIYSLERMGWANGFWNHVWLGVSVENQTRADERIPILLQIPAAKRWVSIEPMLGPVDVRPWLPGCYECSGSCGYRLASEPEEMRCYQCGHEQSAPKLWCVDEHGQDKCPACGEINTIEYPCPQCYDYPMVTQHPDTPCIDWIVLGGETGPGARPMHPDWARSVRDQCQAAGVPIFFKQWGDWVPAKQDEYNPFIYPNQGYVSPISSMAPLPDPGTGYCYSYSPRNLEKRGCAYVAKIGKKAAGHLLDGREWRELP